MTTGMHDLCCYSANSDSGGTSTTITGGSSNDDRGYDKRSRRRSRLSSVENQRRRRHHHSHHAESTTTTTVTTVFSTAMLVMLLLLQTVGSSGVLSFTNLHHHQRRRRHRQRQRQQTMVLLSPSSSVRKQQRSGTSWNNINLHQSPMLLLLLLPPLLLLKSSTSSTNNNSEDSNTTESTAASKATSVHDDDDDLVLKKKTTVVEETLAINRMVHTVMTPGFFLEDYYCDDSNNLKQLYTKSIKMVEVKPSTIANAGLGLFATKNIKAGTIISLYPAHTLGVEFPEGEEIWVTSSNNAEDRTYFEENPPSSSSPYLHATDQPIFGRPSLLANTQFPELKDLPIYLDVNPNNGEELKSTIWVSHYINDGAIVETNDQQGIQQYYLESSKRKNCIHIPFGPSPVMASVTTKKIKKGEELFTSYGCVYWLGSVTTDDDQQQSASSTPEMNAQIQQQIQQSAQDLFTSMKTVQTLYKNQIESFQKAYHDEVDDKDDEDES